MKYIERIWVFVAYKDNVPFFSKLFTDHTKMKVFSAKENTKHKTKNYTSAYFDLTDKSLLSALMDNKNKL